MLRETNRTRLVKDKLIAGLVKASGLGMLVGLLGILIYFFSETVPIFSASSYQQTEYQLPVDGGSLIDTKIDNTGNNGIAINQHGEAIYFSLNDQFEVINHALIQKDPVAIATNSPRPWVAMLDASGDIEVAMPEYIISHSKKKAVYTPNLRVNKELSALAFPDSGFQTKHLGFTVMQEGAVIARASNSKVEVLDYVIGAEEATHHIKALPVTFKQISDIFIAKNGLCLVVLDKEGISIFTRQVRTDAFRLFSQNIDRIGDGAQRAFSFLNGDKGAIISNSHNELEFWFVTFQNERRLRSARKYVSSREVISVIPEHTTKGFWTVDKGGMYSLFYATRPEAILSIDAGRPPLLSSLSRNDKYLINVYKDKITKFEIDAKHPEISVKELTQKVQYEGYSTPDYVWQTSSTEEDVEPKFSLVPLVFGTLKAALYAMLFSVPIAVLGAVYTANFMSTRMRNTIKPAIELMEALPTLVIGFVAAVWLAPIMERNLLAFMLSILVIPLTALICGGIWALLPLQVKSQVPKGLHLITLLPVIIPVCMGLFYVSPYLEKMLFEHGLIYFLADKGWDYQQRNTLVVGIAMGFAVIPTIFTISEDAIYSVPKHLSNGALALGATEWQTLTRVVLLTASPGIISAIMLGLGRAMGETMIVLTVTGNTPITDWNVFEGLRSLTATIATELPESKVGSSHYRLLFLSALILFLFTFIVNSVGESVRQRLRDKYRSL
ncbi:phosphate ABC transporter permease protein PtsC [Vibrio ezurae NBRC 102218]|uniref:Phosphate ABC transporter permease protein PtsC n=1 Tax=Vibrio ezurae NBRC 102218 TaxID=1219080 RepID=U3B5E1_9VIBR|nr:phosphate ABC transporter permease protein PtsC [Vibrio ezurae NBRC 102218]